MANTHGGQTGATEKSSTCGRSRLDRRGTWEVGASRKSLLSKLLPDDSLIFASDCVPQLSSLRLSMLLIENGCVELAFVGLTGLNAEPYFILNTDILYCLYCSPIVPRTLFSACSDKKVIFSLGISGYLAPR